jgi:methylase of polypeptide subunit release factors
MADMFHFYMRKDWGCDAYRVVDIWVGAWHIPIEIFKNDRIRKRVVIEYHWIDNDPQALAAANENAKKIWLNLQLHEWDLLMPLHTILSNNPSPNIALSANLPYNTDEERETYDEAVKAEPRHAIVWWWIDWLDVYRKFLEQFSLVHDKVHMLILQWSKSNTYALCNLCDDLWIPWMHFSVMYDNQNKPRYVLGTRMEPHLYECPNI